MSCAGTGDEPSLAEALRTIGENVVTGRRHMEKAMRQAASTSSPYYRHFIVTARHAPRPPAQTQNT